MLEIGYMGTDEQIKLNVGPICLSSKCYRGISAYTFEVSLGLMLLFCDLRALTGSYIDAIKLPGFDQRVWQLSFPPRDVKFRPGVLIGLNIRP